MTLTNRLLVSLNVVFLLLLAVMYGILTDTRASASTGYKTITIHYISREKNPSGYMNTVCGSGKYTRSMPFSLYTEQGPVGIGSGFSTRYLEDERSWKDAYPCTITFKVPK